MQTDRRLTPRPVYAQNCRPVLEGPCISGLQVALLQGQEGGPLLGRHLLGAHESQGPSPCDWLVIRQLLGGVRRSPRLPTRFRKGLP